MLGQTWNAEHERALRERLGIQLQETRLPDKLTVLETVRLFRSFYRRGPEPRRRDPHSCRSRRSERVGREALGRPAAAAGAGVRARQRSRAAVPRRADDRARPAVAPPALGLIEAFKARGGTVVLTTHYMDEAERLCDRVAIMDHGKIIALGTPAELIASLGAEQSWSSSVEGALELEAIVGAAFGVGRRGARRRVSR